MEKLIAVKSQLAFEIKIFEDFHGFFQFPLISPLKEESKLAWDESDVFCFRVCIGD